jgi:beta-phosphoglucomutase-like phosphatase (HAD superfamily)
VVIDPGWQLLQRWEVPVPTTDSVRAGVLFDVDGVLLDSIPAYRRVWHVWADEYGVSEDAIWSTAHGRRPIDIIRLNAPWVSEQAALRRIEELSTPNTRRYRPCPGRAICCDGFRADGPW